MFKYDEDKLNVSLSVFIFQWFMIQTYFYYISIVRLHPAVWNTFIMSTAKLCHDRFALSYMFIKIAYLHCS